MNYTAYRRGYIMKEDKKMEYIDQILNECFVEKKTRYHQLCN